MEPFGSRIRDELLAVEQFSRLAEAQVMVEDWRCDYNEHRPHSALAMMAPARFAKAWAQAVKEGVSRGCGCRKLDHRASSRALWLVVSATALVPGRRSARLVSIERRSLTIRAGGEIVSLRTLMTSAAVAALLAGCGGSSKLASHQTAHGSAKAALPADAGAGCLTHTRPPLCYAPKQFRVAYGVQPLVNRGIDGRGRTVVLLESTVPSPTLGETFIQEDLARYESRFGLPVAGLEVVSESAGSPSAALASREEVLDVEMVHAIAPGARIRVVLIGGTPENTSAAAVAAVLRALSYAVGHNLGDVISLSVGIGEHCLTRAQVSTLHSVLRAARDRQITVLASAGDFGAAAKPCGVASKFVRGVVLPASEPLVTAVGGTRLLANPFTGRYVGEISWNRSPRPGAVGRKGLSAASGGGLSSLFSRPSYQDGIGGADSRRGVPDVAADADPATGLALLAYRRGQNHILAGGGTSASAPLWAAIAALADQYAGRRLGFLNAGLYRIGRGSRYHDAFHDITRGNNTVLFPPARIAGYRAAPGWDPVTGWGSPNAEVLVPLLARHVLPDDGGGL